MLNNDQLLDQARRYETQAHNAYDKADSLVDTDPARARKYYRRGEWFEAAADLCRAEASEIGAPA